MPAFEPVSSPWRRGPFRLQPSHIVFGQTYEDSDIELRAFRPQSRVFTIAGAGMTARALAARGHRVTAVDINPLQLAYAESRAAGGPARPGAVERLLALGRRLATLAGWSRGKLTEFLNLPSCEQQVEYWDRCLDTHLWRAAVDTFLSRHLLGLCYAGPFVHLLPQEFGRHVRNRLRRGWAKHSNRTNPYAAALLLGVPLGDAGVRRPGPARHPVRFICADAADFLERSPRSAFDAFALSNIGDGASPEYVRRLHRAVEHAAAPGALVASRSFAEPRSDSEPNWAEQDRSLLWGVVAVRTIAEFGKGGA